MMTSKASHCFFAAKEKLLHSTCVSAAIEAEEAFFVVFFSSAFETFESAIFSTFIR